MATHYYQYPVVSVTSGPVSFTRNGATQTVTEDTAVPANNRPLPTELTGPNGPVTSTVAGLNTSLDVNVVSSATVNVNIHDGAGTSLTSQVNGAQRALDVGIDVAGVQVDPRAIRALVNTDVVKSQVQDNAGNGLTSQVNGAQRALDVGIDVAGVQVDPRAIRALVNTDVVKAQVQDNAGNGLTSQVNGAARALDVGVNVAGVQVDPRAIRALVNTDVVKSQLQDNAGTGLTSTLVGGTKQSLDVNVTASAAPSPSSGRAKVDLITNDYSSVNVTTAAYVQLLASTAATINLLDVSDTSGQTLVFAVGAAASEVNQFYIYPGGNGPVQLAIPSGSRLSVKAVSATASSGRLVINTFS